MSAPSRILRYILCSSVKETAPVFAAAITKEQREQAVAYPPMQIIDYQAGLYVDKQTGHFTSGLGKIKRYILINSPGNDIPIFADEITQMDTQVAQQVPEMDIIDMRHGRYYDKKRNGFRPMARTVTEAQHSHASNTIRA